jgi:hypothetical protein
MGINLKEHIKTKAHDASIKKLKTKRVPPKIVSSLSVSFLEDIAETLSEVTQSTFNYTGNLKYDSGKIVSTFTSSETSSAIKMIISYNKETLEEDYKFDNLNEVIEESIIEDPEPEVEEVEEIVEQVEEPEVPSNPIPNFSGMVDTAIEIGKKEKEEEKRQKLQEMVDNSLNELDKIEKTDKINKILDALEEQTPIEKKEDKLLSILKNV